MMYVKTTTEWKKYIFRVIDAMECFVCADVLIQLVIDMQLNVETIQGANANSYLIFWCSDNNKLTHNTVT